jgi:hypothetical protein
MHRIYNSTAVGISTNEEALNFRDCKYAYYGLNYGLGTILSICRHFEKKITIVARVLGYRSGGPGSIPGTTRKKSSGSGTGSTQPRDYN